LRVNGVDPELNPHLIVPAMGGVGLHMFSVLKKPDSDELLLITLAQVVL
jgi:hypothetical protein